MHLTPRFCLALTRLPWLALVGLLFAHAGGNASAADAPKNSYAATAPSASAASATAPETIRLPQLEVIAQRPADDASLFALPSTGVLGDLRLLLDTPRAATTLSPERLDQLGLRSLDQLAALAPGTSAPASYGLLTTPVIRGDTAETFVNGQRLSYNNYGYLPSFNSVEAIDLVRGPASVVFGAGYLVGGYVNYQTKQPDPAVIRTTVTTNVGTWLPGRSDSFAQGTIQLDHSQVLSSELAMRVSLEGKGGETFYQRNSVPDNRQDVFTAVSWRPSDAPSLKIEGHAQYFHQDTPETLGVNRITQALIDDQIYASDTGPVKLGRDAVLFSRGDRSDAAVTRAQAIVTSEVSPALRLVNRSLYEHVDRDREHQFGYREDVVQHTAENRTEAHYAFTALGLAQHTLAGLSLRQEWRDVAATYDYPAMLASYDITASSRVYSLGYHPGGAYEASRSAIFNPALFWQHEVRLTPTLTALAGLREDAYFGRARGENTFAAPTRDQFQTRAFSQNYSLTWKPAPAWTAYFTYNRLATLSTNGSAVGGAYYFSGPEVDTADFRRPSTLKELGLKTELADRRLALAVAAFEQTRSRDEFAASTDLVVQGIELEATLRPATSWEAYANTTLQNGHYDGALLYQAVNYNTPPSYGQLPVGDWDLLGFSNTLVNAGLRYTFAPGWTAGLSGSWQSGQNVNIPDPAAAPPYDTRLRLPAQFTLNASLSYTQPRWSATLDVLNFTDEHNWLHNGDVYTGAALISQELPLRVQGRVKFTF